MQDIILIPWNVFFPSFVSLLWSTLSATNCIQISSPIRTLSSNFSTAAHASYFCISENDEESPNENNVSMRKREPNCLYICIPYASWRGHIILRGLVICIVACPIDATFRFGLFSCAMVFSNNCRLLEMKSKLSRKLEICWAVSMSLCLFPLHWCRCEWAKLRSWLFTFFPPLLFDY